MGNRLLFPSKKFYCSSNLQKYLALVENYILSAPAYHFCMLRCRLTAFLFRRSFPRVSPQHL